MTMKHFTRLALTGCAAAMALTFSAFAYDTGVTTDDGLRLRSEPSTSATIRSILPKGQSLSVLEVLEDWYKVDVNGTEGYVFADFVDVDHAEEIAEEAVEEAMTAQESSVQGNAAEEETAKEEETVRGIVTGGTINVRKGPSTDYEKITPVRTGKAVVFEGSENGWYKVSYNGTAGYVHSDYVSLSGVTSNGGSTAGSNGSVKGSDVRMRSGPGTNYSILGTYQNGTALTVTGTENGWSKVTIGGVSGYIRSDYVSGGADSKTGYIKGTGVRMRSGASTTSSILGVYNTGTEMTITGESGNWYQVSYSGKDGYVSKDYMTTTKPDNGGGSACQTGYIKGNDVRLRSGAGTN